MVVGPSAGRVSSPEMKKQKAVVAMKKAKRKKKMSPLSLKNKTHAQRYGRSRRRHFVASEKRVGINHPCGTDGRYGVASCGERRIGIGNIKRRKYLRQAVYQNEYPCNHQPEQSDLQEHFGIRFLQQQRQIVRVASGIIPRIGRERERDREREWEE